MSKKMIPYDVTDRAYVLLRAAFDIIKRSEIERIVATEALAAYDDTNCDGFCLLEDIAAEIEGLDVSDNPIPLYVED